MLLMSPCFKMPWLGTLLDPLSDYYLDQLANGTCPSAMAHQPIRAGSRSPYRVNHVCTFGFIASTTIL